MGQINSKSLEILIKADGNGLNYDGDVTACDVCAIGKSA